MIARYETQIGLLIAVVAFPFLPGMDNYLGSGATAAVFTVVAASLVMLTGWVGQISLAHAAFVGVGAYATGWAVGTLGLGFPLSLPVAVLVASGTAALLGVVALRVRGLYLAVATLIFSWAASEYLFRQTWLLDQGSVPAQAVGTPDTPMYLDFGSRFVHYYVAWIVAVAVLYALVNLRDSKTGRAFYAVRGSEMAAASLGMNVLRYKLLAFSLSGGIAGIAGNLTMTHSRVVSPDAFDLNGSLFYLAIAVVGGLTSLPGAVAAGILFAAMSELFFQVPLLNEYLQLASAGLLAVIFRLYPGGLASMGNSLVERWRAAAAAARALPGAAGRRAEALAAWLESRRAEAVEDTDRTASRPGDEPVADDATAKLAGWIRAGARLAVRPLVAGARAATGLIVRRGEGTGTAQTEPLSLMPVVATGGAPAPIAAPSAGLADASHGYQGNGHRPDLQDASQLRETPSDDAASERGFHVPEPPSAHTLRLNARRRHERPALIEAKNVTVRFGGLTAVNDASLSVREGEITGLIGPNGAGKTTLFNSIAGFNVPTEGSVHLYGQDVTEMPVFRRAQLGVGRTFQLIQLFPQITVFENLLAATHLQNATGFVQHMAASPAALHSEMAARDRVRRAIELLELDGVSDRLVAGLPFGILRMVEVARCLVTGARVIMLDEPASGLDERETDRLTDVLRFVRSLGASLLLIEHDVRMVTSVTDYLYVLEQGQIIAEGTPDEIQSNPDVVAAYLGTPVPEAV